MITGPSGLLRSFETKITQLKFIDEGIDHADHVLIVESSRPNDPETASPDPEKLPQCSASLNPPFDL